MQTQTWFTVAFLLVLLVLAIVSCRLMSHAEAEAAEEQRKSEAYRAELRYRASSPQ